MAIEYREETPDGWSERVAATWTVTDRNGGYDLSGACPTCGDHCEMPVIVVSAVPGQPAGDKKSGAENGPEQLTVICNCKLAHPGAPPGARGCGRGGFLVLHRS
jgi:hypothetical protein